MASAGPSAPAPGQTLPAEVNVAVDTYGDNGDDGDSAYDSEVASYTTSLASAVTAYKFENGRRYHAYKEGSYIFPNDEKEKERLDILHKVVELTMSNKLCFAPIKNPRRVLDIGTGTGIWAMEFGDQYPNSDVLGNDLSPIQPQWVPANVHFEVDDIEAAWTYSQKFDFIHCRSMNNAIHDWPKLLRQTFENLQPGGYAEFVDWDVTWVSPDNSIPEDGAIRKLNREFLRVIAESGGADPNPGLSLEKWFKEAGFAGVHCSKFPAPFGTWPADRRMKEIGAWNYLQLTEGLEGMLYYVFTRLLGLTKEEVDVLAAKFRQELKNPRIHPMCHIYLVYGHKPEDKAAENA